MRISDLFSMALSNLKQRKSRTLLTSIGVMIGCTSIVVMVSIGMGLSESMNSMLENMGDLRTIQIYGKNDGKTLKTSDVSAIETVSGIASVAPKTSFPNDYMTGISASNGRFVADWAMVTGTDENKLDDQGYELLDGDLKLSGTGSAIPVLVGENFAYNFRDSMRPDGSNYIDRWQIDENGMLIEDEKPDPWFDPMKTDLTLSISNPNNPEGESYKVTLHPVGMLRENYQIGQETSDGFLMSDKDLDKITAEAARQFGIRTPEKNITQIVARTQDISQVGDAENEMKSLGYNTSSMKSIRDSLEEQSRTIQMILGGIGAISLIVAAIGITNTMIMSVSERTREIGIMKALGCRTSDIRMMFLSEAGMIGLLGGVAGIILSFLISLGINFASWQFAGSQGSFWDFLTGTGQRASVIPVWLVIFALVFSLLIGVLSGMIPAARSVKISALEAIRRE